jgi:hypothetical protein
MPLFLPGPGPLVHPTEQGLAGFDAVAGGTTFNQDLTATVTSTATIQNQIGKAVTATATSTATSSGRSPRR